MGEQNHEQHLALTLYGCNPLLIRTKPVIVNYAKFACQSMDVTPVGECWAENFAEHDPTVAGYSMMQPAMTPDGRPALVSAHYVEEDNSIHLDLLSSGPFNAPLLSEHSAHYYRATNHTVQLFCDSPTDEPVLIDAEEFKSRREQKEVWGLHTILEFENPGGYNPSALEVEAFVRKACNGMNVTRFGECQFVGRSHGKPRVYTTGYSVILPEPLIAAQMIQTSLLSLFLSPDRIRIDAFSCKWYDVHALIACAIVHFPPKRIYTRVLKR